MAPYGVGYPFGQLGSAALTLSLPSFFCTPSLLSAWVGHEAEHPLALGKHCSAITKVSLYYQQAFTGKPKQPHSSYYKENWLYHNQIHENCWFKNLRRWMPHQIKLLFCFAILHVCGASSQWKCPKRPHLIYIIQRAGACLLPACSVQSCLKSFKITLHLNHDFFCKALKTAEIPQRHFWQMLL